MSPNEKKLLLAFAREAVEAAASGDPPPEVPGGEVFLKRGGAFVTLKKGGMLRGCIGHFAGLGTLGETVRAMAREAALGDPRFNPVETFELEQLNIEISVLSPMRGIEPEEVVPGLHGLYVRRGPRAGTLLPQVAREEGWDRETFLAHTCLKAGLPPMAWLDRETELLAYTAEVFSESSLTEKEQQ